MRILCVGHTAFDRVFMVDAVVAPPAKVAARDYFELGGGMAANGAVAIAHLGAQAEFWGPAGDDAIAEAMAADFRHHGVDATYMRRIPGRRSSHSAILVDSHGERLIVGMRGDVLADPGDWLPLERLAGAGAMLADVRWPPGSERAMIAAREAGVPTVLDGDTGTRDVLRRLVAHADYAVFSEPGFAGFTDRPTREGLAEALALGARAAVVTRGERGCEWITREAPDTLHHLPAFPALAVDTTGAGDAFHGAFTIRIAEGAPVEDAIRFASAAGALKVARRGARSMPSRAQVEAYLAVF
jgi:sulfofructose kinase